MKAGFVAQCVPAFTSESLAALKSNVNACVHNCRCGDILFGNGTGGESIYGKKFKDDQKGGCLLCSKLIVVVS